MAVMTSSIVICPIADIVKEVYDKDIKCEK